MDLRQNFPVEVKKQTLSSINVDKFPPLRVLFIVDSIYWVLGNFFYQIKKDNPWLEAQICSHFAIRKTLKRFGGFRPTFDVIHFLRTKPIKFLEGKLPFVSTLHHADSGTELAHLHESDAVMIVSTEWRNYLMNKGIPSHKLCLVPFGVDTKVFYPPNEEERLQIRQLLNLSKESLVIGFSARRTYDADGRKGVDCFIQALRLVKQQVSNIATIIIGPGWRKLAHKLEMEGITYSLIPYHINHEEIAKYYHALDVFWTTARIEGGPVPLLEAMASGIPCISTPVGAALDLIKDQKNGFIIPFDSPQQIANLTNQIAEKKDFGKRIGIEARKTILQERTWSQTQRKLFETYQLAIRNFEAANYQESTQNWKNNRSKESRRASSRLPTIEPDLVSTKLQKWMLACEHLNGLKKFVEMGEWRAAIRTGFRVLKTAPFDYHIWLELFEVFIQQTRKSHLNYKKITINFLGIYQTRT